MNMLYGYQFNYFLPFFFFPDYQTQTIPCQLSKLHKLNREKLTFGVPLDEGEATEPSPSLDAATLSGLLTDAGIAGARPLGRLADKGVAGVTGVAGEDTGGGAGPATMGGLGPAGGDGAGPIWTCMCLLLGPYFRSVVHGNDTHTSGCSRSTSWTCIEEMR